MPAARSADPFSTYLGSIRRNLQRGDATEHTHRDVLKALIESLEPPSKHLVATNEPRRAACGAPDFNVTRNDVPVGNIETKDIGTNLDEAERSEQLQRYFPALNNLILTDYLEFRWYVYGELRVTVRLARRDPAGRLHAEPGGPEALGNLLDGFLSEVVPTVAKPKELAERMARMAHLMRDLMEAALRHEPEGQLHAQLRAFRRVLLPELEPAEFADMYAQTIAYGLFAARANTPPGQRFTRQAAAFNLPRTNPFLRRLFGDIAGPGLDDRIAWAADNLAELLNRADMGAILQHFARKQGREDPVIDFYETFLHAYDPKLREVRGVYYTPEPVVSYIVRSVDHLLKTRFDCPNGLADTSIVKHAVPTDTGMQERAYPRVLILDPACGTGTFLYFVIQRIRQNLAGQHGAWPAYVRDHLLPRLFGFELLMAPYAVAHMKLGIELKDSGYDFAGDERLGIYLTNTLEEARPRSQLLFAQYIADEANAAAEIKRSSPIMVILGNPPYSGHSANASWRYGRYLVNPRTGRGKRVLTWIGKKIRDYYKVDGWPLGERNPKWLQDDYVKFIRFGQWRIEQTGSGVLAFITNHAYLDNPTFRGMRQQLMQAFDEIYVLDLHGSSRKKEVAPDGGKDENVFDIQQGVAISIFVKGGRGTPAAPGRDKSVPPTTARIFHAELWGVRRAKYEVLLGSDVASLPWGQLSPVGPNYLFVPGTLVPQEYQAWLRITEMLPIHSIGMNTHRDGFAVALADDTLRERVTILRDTTVSDRDVAQRFPLKGLNVADARRTVRQDAQWRQHIVRSLYRPFDFRALFYSSAVIDRPRPELNRHMLKPNISLITTRQTREPFAALVADVVCSQHKIVARYDGSYVFPCYLYPAEPSELRAHRALGDASPWPAGPGGRRPNLNPQFVRDLEQRLGMTFVPDGKGDLGGRGIPAAPRRDKSVPPTGTFGPEDIFNYIYAILHSPTYRQRYAEFLKRDFPRIPLTSKRELFAALCAKGEELVELHLMESPRLADFITTYPVAGDNRVEKVRYAEPKTENDGTQVPGRVYINKTQYFEGVSPELWNFHVGGYQVMEKWLKDRKGRALTWPDIQHYQKIAVALTETTRLMREIDGLIPCWPLP